MIITMYIFGILCLISGISQIQNGSEYASELIISSLVLLVGATISLSAKKRKYYLLKNFTMRGFFEITGFFVILIIILAKNDQKYHIANFPFTHVIIPLVVVFYYLYCVFSNKKNEPKNIINPKDFEDVITTTNNNNLRNSMSLNEMVERKYLGTKKNEESADTNEKTYEKTIELSLSDKIAIIERLARLKEAGHLTEEEYNQQKNIIMK